MFIKLVNPNQKEEGQSIHQSSGFHPQLQLARTQSRETQSDSTGQQQAVRSGFDSKITFLPFLYTHTLHTVFEKGQGHLAAMSMAVTCQQSRASYVRMCVCMCPLVACREGLLRVQFI